MPEPGKAAAGTYAGIDTHKDFHVVAVIDHLGRQLDTHTAKTTEEGYRQLLQWLSTFIPIIRIGVEGTGSYGASVAAILGEHGFDVVEVNRPNRQMRRFRGKNDAVDAEAAARSVLSESASAIPKSHDGLVESIRLLRVSLTSLRKYLTALTNSLRNVIVGAPPFMREQLESMTATALVTHCSRLQVAAGAPTDPVQALKSTLRALSTHIYGVEGLPGQMNLHLQWDGKYKAYAIQGGPP
ncbi:MAG: transposase [Rhodococcus sp. (in: high G+C Gram-positive bacteria)]|uniref:IS110 family transposase n=1 Tax=Rhodococcus sp. TaxID=1831 RepID=UPI002AD9FCE2|nr:transposase [Rhodococcus sp. (in: high G+C Gram-positive bacteria)]